MGLPFKIDENLPAELCDLFRSAGHDAVTALDQQLGGQSDRAIAEVCQREGRALVTLDLDFADIRAYPPEDYVGIIVLRPARQDVEWLLHIGAQLIERLKMEVLVGRLWIADETTLRIRPGQ